MLEIEMPKKPEEMVELIMAQEINRNRDLLLLKRFYILK